MVQLENPIHLKQDRKNQQKLLKIYNLAGEISGDNYGALLARNLKQISPQIEISGTGGEKMKKEGVQIIEGMPTGYMGYSSIILKLPEYLKFFKKVVSEINNTKPDIIIFVDNPGFNLKVAETLGKKFLKIYYIPPKVWAHNYKRVKKIKRNIDLVIPIFPFEKDIYEKEKIPFKYLGHPVVDLIQKGEKIEKERRIIGILPGSRIQEIRYIFPVILKIVSDLKKELDFDILTSSANEKIYRVIEKIIKEKKVIANIVKRNPYTLIENSDVILATCGTVNLEVALMKRPLIVFYKTSFLNYLIASFMVKLNVVSPVNLFLEEKIVPEYLQKIPEEKVKEDIVDLIKKGEIYKKQMHYFSILKKKAGNLGVSRKVAEFILDFYKSKAEKC